MNITKFSLSQNRVVLSLLAVVVILGLVSYNNLSRDSMPPFTIRVATIVTSFPGASPERVEELITDKIEKVAQELPELKEVTSTSRTGLSVVSVELKMDVAPNDLQAVWDRLRRKLNTIQGLPQNAVPQLNDEGIGEVFGIAVALVNDGFSYKEIKDYADDLRDDLIVLDDAAKVEINGAQEERVFIKFNDNKLKKYGVSSSTLQNVISSTNILKSGGEINLASERLILEPTGNFTSIVDIENLLIPIGSSGKVIALKDIAAVEKGYIYPPSQIVYVNGQPAISLHVSLKEGRNIIQLGQDVNRIVNEYNSKLPIGLDVKRISSIDSYIDQKIKDFIVNLVQSVVIVLAVMLVFLGLRTGLVISSLIPLVTISTLFIMSTLGVGLNQISLAALIMALGMMVDNGIVVAESIMVKMEDGKSAKDAAIESGQELFTPLLISTLTTSAAFLSFYLAESVMGDIMGPLFVVISIALISSWLISLTIITLFSVYFLRIQPKGEKEPSFLDRLIGGMKTAYKDLMIGVLHWRRVMIFGIVGLFVASMFGFGLLEVLFFPDSDRNMITVDINLPLGTRIEETQEVVRGIEGYIKDELQVNDTRKIGVEDWSSFVGEGPSSYDLGYSADEPNSSYAHMLLNTSSFESNNYLVQRLDSFCFLSFPNADIKLGLLAAGGGGTPIEIKVSGDDPDKLAEIAESIKAKLFGIKGTKNIKDDWGPKGKKFVIQVDPYKSRNVGITNQDIAISLETVLTGFNTGEYREGTNSIPIILQNEQSKNLDLASLETMSIISQSSGTSVPLLQIAEIVPQWQYAKIKRLDLVRSINVSSEITSSGNANEIMSEVTPWLKEVSAEWGDEYSYSLGGDAQNSSENMGAVADYLPVSGFIIIMLLIIQFNSFRKATMVVLTIPLGGIGMVMGLLIFQVPFGFMAFLGVISLAGIVINNAIVLIDRIQIEKEEFKRSDQDAIVSACLQRFRPIILATFTTVLGLIPLYLGGGAMWEPMAVTIMVGLMFGTIVTLLFIPSLYSLLYKVDFSTYKFNQELLD
jgi:multidrug efflux pump subunit AcrB